jgi:wyosine [tRNA(Phe)-imidazoG37] synthetase (radical SAM superfamily)
MKYVFGPVQSRRLGKSLGIDPIPLKTCNWNCVYCQLGRTRPLTNIRREYIPRKDIWAEIQQALIDHKPGDIDWVTFVGSGEPTLYDGLGWLIRHVQRLTSLPVAVITNGALLYLPEVRADLAAADAVLPSLDAGNSRLYRKINRPWPKLTFDGLLEGLITFRKQYAGQLWVEVMLLKDLNDTAEALQEIAKALEKIRPDQEHLLLPVRPPAEAWVQPSDTTGLKRAQDILGEVASAVIPESIHSAPVTAASSDDLVATILGIITRHPMCEEELSAALKRWSPNEVHNILEILLATGRVQLIERFGQSFWSAAESFYANDTAHS